MGNLSLWSGTELRENVQQHLTMYFGELEEVVKSGLDLFINGVMEKFIEMLFFCALILACSKKFSVSAQQHRLLDATGVANS